MTDPELRASRYLNGEGTSEDHIQEVSEEGTEIARQDLKFRERRITKEVAEALNEDLMEGIPRAKEQSQEGEKITDMNTQRQIRTPHLGYNRGDFDTQENFYIYDLARRMAVSSIENGRVSEELMDEHRKLEEPIRTDVDRLFKTFIEISRGDK